MASTLVNGVKPNIIVAYPSRFFEMVVNPVELDKDKITVKVGEKFDRDFVIEILIEYGFERVDFVYEQDNFH